MKSFHEASNPSETNWSHHRIVNPQSYLHGDLHFSLFLFGPQKSLVKWKDSGIAILQIRKLRCGAGDDCSRCPGWAWGAALVLGWWGPHLILGRFNSHISLQVVKSNVITYVDVRFWHMLVCSHPLSWCGWQIKFCWLECWYLRIEKKIWKDQLLVQQLTGCQCPPQHVSTPSWWPV